MRLANLGIPLQVAVWAALGTASITACSDVGAPPSAPSPLQAISDGAHPGGNAHFYFLPPIQRQPWYTGVFDPTLRPVVRITQGTALLAALDAALDSVGEAYQANWHTDDYSLDPSQSYRISVVVGARELGFADIDVVERGSSLRNVNTGEYVGVVDGRTLPVRFRIEQGAVPSCALDFNADHFATGAWVRTSNTVMVANGALIIGNDGALDDGFSAACSLPIPWELDVTARIVSDGQNWVFPGVHVQLANGWRIRASSLPDGLWGWLFARCDPFTWPANEVLPTIACASERQGGDGWSLEGPSSVREREFMTLRITADGINLRLFARPEGQPDFALVREVPFTGDGQSVTRVGISQPWNAAVEVREVIGW